MNNETVYLLGGLTPLQWADLYSIVFNIQVTFLISTERNIEFDGFQVFFAPAIAIVASYSRIYFLLKR